MSAWRLEQAGVTLAEGTEAQVKTAAQDMADAAGTCSSEAFLRCELYLVKPDGAVQVQALGNGYFTHGEPITWINDQIPRLRLV